GQKIVWPKPTHGRPDDPEVIAGRKLPWRTAAEIIDWSLPCPSIFDTGAEIMEKLGLRAVRPLADATMSRVARGVDRYVLKAKKPFLVRTDMASAAARNGVQDVDSPLNTIMTAGSFAAISPSVIRFNTGATGHD
ncbi:MAG: C-5 cytosine-specific DNA methylase, partial [Mesorhizobium sp.]